VTTAAAPAQDIHFTLRGEHITLDALLKATGLASSGGDAKLQIAAGQVMVNHEPELRRGRKLRAGDQVVVGAQRIQLQGA
jgi:ribosome-associated protein